MVAEQNLKTKPFPSMSAGDVVELVQLLRSNNISVWVDGGWAVDAVIERETRAHEDLDIAVRHFDVPLLRILLESKGFRNVPRDDTRDCNFVLGDANGRQIDIHSFTFDEQGQCIFGIPYPAASLTGKGTIRGLEIDCISPEWLLKFKTSYEPKQKDIDDVRLLCEKFDFELPAKYRPKSDKV